MGTKISVPQGLRFLIVSIQLISPASGDYANNAKLHPDSHVVSIQLISPASGDVKAENAKKVLAAMFPFN